MRSLWRRFKTWVHRISEPGNDEGYVFLEIRSAEGRHAPLPQGVTAEMVEESRQEVLKVLREGKK